MVRGGACVLIIRSRPVATSAFVTLCWFCSQPSLDGRIPGLYAHLAGTDCNKKSRGDYSSIVQAIVILCPHHDQPRSVHRYSSSPSRPQKKLPRQDIMARVPLPVDTYRRLNEQEPKWHIKAILRILGTLVAIIAVILFAVSVSYTNQNFINTTGAGDWTDGLAIAPVSHHQLEPIMKNAIQKKNPQKDRPPTEHDVRSVHPHLLP